MAAWPAPKADFKDGSGLASKALAMEKCRFPGLCLDVNNVQLGGEVGPRNPLYQ